METQEAILRACRDGKTAQEIADLLNISRNQAIGVIAKNGGAEKVRGYIIRRGRAADNVPVANRVCYIQGCNRAVENRPHEDFRMCLQHRRTATEGYSGLGNVGAGSGKRNGVALDKEF